MRPEAVCRLLDIESATSRIAGLEFSAIGRKGNLLSLRSSVLSWMETRLKILTVTGFSM